jgi:hypothetical protein
MPDPHNISGIQGQESQTNPGRKRSWMQRYRRDALYSFRINHFALTDQIVGLTKQAAMYPR